MANTLLPLMNRVNSFKCEGQHPLQAMESWSPVAKECRVALEMLQRRDVRSKQCLCVQYRSSHQLGASGQSGCTGEPFYLQATPQPPSPGIGHNLFELKWGLGQVKTADHPAKITCHLRFPFRTRIRCTSCVPLLYASKQRNSKNAFRASQAQRQEKRNREMQVY